jgi:hypothetical protein
VIDLTEGHVVDITFTHSVPVLRRVPATASGDAPPCNTTA